MKDKDRRPRNSNGPAGNTRPPIDRSGKDRASAGSRSFEAGKPSGFSKPPRSSSRELVREPVRADSDDTAAAQAVQLPLALRDGEKPAERIPVILETAASGDYHLIDSGNALKLEQYGPYRIVRPEAQALWPPALPPQVWDQADAVFTGDTDEDGMGRWRFGSAPIGETWPMRLLDTDFLGRLTSFRHVGVFPEQLAHWSWVVEQQRSAGRPLKVLNLFGYTGVASLIAARAGAEVTHVDASKRAIAWARENQALGNNEKLPIRWICDDAMKFIQREARRGSRYDIILTDPPKFGRGPNGEVWHLFEHLPRMLDTCRDILTADASGLVLTAYSIRASFYSIHELMRETMRGCSGVVESGELIIREAGLDGRSPARALSTSLFSRWVPK